MIVDSACMVRNIHVLFPSVTVHHPWGSGVEVGAAVVWAAVVVSGAAVEEVSGASVGSSVTTRSRSFS